MTVKSPMVRSIAQVRWSRLLIYAVLIAFALFYLMPVYVLVITSLKSFDQVSVYRMWELPSELRLESFKSAWVGDMGYRGMSANFFNSIYITVPATLLSALLGSINGYILSKWRFRGSDLLFTLLLFGMFIPYQSVLIPLVQVLTKIGLYGRISGLVLTNVVYGIPITTLIFRNYYVTVPTDLVDAARIDGANIFGVYRRILLPLSMPAFVVVMIWQFTSIWNGFLFAVTVTPDPKVQPLPVALNNLAGSYIVEWNVQMAGALITALPPLVVYLLLGRYFMRGLMAGSLK